MVISVQSTGENYVAKGTTSVAYIDRHFSIPSAKVIVVVYAITQLPSRRTISLQVGCTVTTVELQVLITHVVIVHICHDSY